MNLRDNTGQFQNLRDNTGHFWKIQNIQDITGLQDVWDPWTIRNSESESFFQDNYFVSVSNRKCEIK